MCETESFVRSKPLCLAVPPGGCIIPVLTVGLATDSNGAQVHTEADDYSVIRASEGGSSDRMISAG